MCVCVSVCVCECVCVCVCLCVYLQVSNGLPEAPGRLHAAAQAILCSRNGEDVTGLQQAASSGQVSVKMQPMGGGYHLVDEI